MITLKYRGILNILTEEILSGRYGVPGSFPGERGLMKRFGAARETMRRALSLLESQGFIRRHPGKATVVFDRTTDVHPKIGVLYAGEDETEIFRSIACELKRQASPAKVEIVSGRSLSAARRTILEQARRLIATGVRGVILHPTQDTSECELRNIKLTKLFRSAGVQVVLVGCDVVRRPRRSDFDLVGIDDFGAGRAVAEHVVTGGARKITFVARQGCPSSVLERLSGIRTVKPRAQIEVKALPSLSDSRQIARALMECGELDAIICQDDFAAQNVALVLRKMGIRIPTEVMLVGFDDVTMADKQHPGLTSVRHPCGEIARQALRLILDRLANPTMSPIRIICRESLVARGSTDRNWN